MIIVFSHKINQSVFLKSSRWPQEQPIIRQRDPLEENERTQRMHTRYVLMYLVKLGDGGQVEEDAAIFHLHREGQQLHVFVLHVV